MNLIAASAILTIAFHANLALAATSEDSAFTPNRISHDRLSADPLHVPNESLLIDSLSTEGLVSITDIPGFGKIKRDTLAHLHACIMEQGDAFPHQILRDGTIRRTIGTVTLPADNGSAPQPIAWRENSEDASLSASCLEFSKNLNSFRAKVDETTSAFANRLSFEMGNSLPTPLMTTQDGSHDFDEIKDIVSSGEHLEHFHSYQKTEHSVEEQTLDFHVDQGFFIAFSPGLVVSHTEDKKADLSKPLVQSEGFFVEMSDGKRSLVQFDDSDDLVFLIGDGANQYINNKIHNDSTSQQKKLRVAPHAVSLKTHDSSLARVWYGRMVLPPKDAVNVSNDQTYGEVRNILNTIPDKEKYGGLGCSSSIMRALASDNSTEPEDDHDDGHDAPGTICDSGSVYCWFRCMETAPYDIVDETTCVDQGLELKCINPRGQVSDGHSHGDYYPACTDSTQEVTPYPSLPEAPQDVDVCHADAWDGFSLSDGYDHAFDLTTDKTAAKFQWSVKDNGNTAIQSVGTKNNENKVIKARLSFNGQFGWLSFGFLNLDPDARHNGMNGANVLLALPGNDYTASEGLDLSVDHGVKEYQIGVEGSSFRHWSTPANTLPTNAEIEYDGCFTAITFELNSINGETFDFEGRNHVLWAGNGLDAFVGYHLRNRAIFTVEWTNGKAYFGKEEDHDDDSHDSHDHGSHDHGSHDHGSHDDSGDESSGASSTSMSFITLTSAFLSLLVSCLI